MIEGTRGYSALETKPTGEAVDSSVSLKETDPLNSRIREYEP